MPNPSRFHSAALRASWPPNGSSSTGGVAAASESISVPPPGLLSTAIADRVGWKLSWWGPAALEAHQPVRADLAERREPGVVPRVPAGSIIKYRRRPWTR